MAEPRYRRFYDLSVSERILNTVFLLAIGIGYTFALANLYYTHQARDGQAGLSINDIIIAYHGSQTKTRLEAAINGIMEPNLKYKSDKEVILKWIHDGAGEAEYQEKVSPIFNRDCVMCHSPDINPTLPNLTTYQGAAEVAQAGGASLPALIRVSHIHLFGITFILYFIGRIFLLCQINVILKRITVAIPFIAMFLDIASWFITRHIPGFAYLVVTAGALMGISMGAQILLSLYQMWFFRRHTLNTHLSNEQRLQACREALNYYGREIVDENGGWIVKESAQQWTTINSIDALEAYARIIEVRHQQAD